MPIVETISSPFKSRERILGFGREGTGKSSAVLSIARKIPNVNFWIIDNDNSYERLLETDFPDVAENGNLLFCGQDFGGAPNTWKGGIAGLADASDKMARDDWLVADMLSKFWDHVQEWFVESIFQEDIDDYFLKVRMEKARLKDSSGKDKKALGAFEGWMDWPVINSTYHKRVSDKLLNCPGHLFCTAEAKKIEEDDDKGVRELYGPFSMKPSGQKRSGHLMQTVLIMSKTSRTDEFKLNSVKDRGRMMWRDEVFQDFATDYLVGTAGWTVKKEFVK